MSSNLLLKNSCRWNACKSSTRNKRSYHVAIQSDNVKCRCTYLLHRKYVLLKRFPLQQRICCNPFNLHASNKKGKLELCLVARMVRFEKASDFKAFISFIVILHFKTVYDDILGAYLKGSQTKFLNFLFFNCIYLLLYSNF